MYSRAIFVVGIALGFVVPASAQLYGPTNAQMNRQRQLQQQQIQPFEADGLIEATAPGKLQINTNANQKWLVFIDPQAKVQLTGSATADFIKPGTSVSFTAEADKQGNVKDKVAQLTVFTPDAENPAGVTVAVGAGGDVAPDGLGKGPGGGEPGKRGGKKTGRAGAMAEGGTYTIAGQVTNILRTGKISLNADGRVFKFDLADDVKIDVKLADYSLAQKGDKVTVKGKMYPGKAGVGLASEVRIEAAAPLSGGGNSKPFKPAPKPRQPKKGAPGKGPADTLDQPNP